MSIRPKIVRLAMWAVLIAILTSWLAAAVRNPHRAEKVFAVAYTPDGSLLAMGTNDATTILWDATTGKKQAVLNKDGYPDWTQFVVFSPDGAILATGGDSYEVKLWDITSRQLIRTLSTNFGNDVNCAAFAPDGKTLATGSEDDTVRLWDWKNSPKPREFITSHKYRVNCISFTLDGSVIATGSDDETVKLTDANTGQEIATLFRDDGSEVVHSVRSVAFSPDGETLIVGMDGGTIVIWDVMNQRQRAELQHGSNSVGSVKFSKDGKYFASGSWDGTAMLWDALTNEPIHTFRADSRWVWSVIFSPDGRHLVTGGDDGTAKVWDVASGEKLMTLVAERPTAQWWMLALLVWGIAYAYVRVKTSGEFVPVDDVPTQGDNAPVEISSLDSNEAVLTLAIYVCGGFMYAVLCGPAIGRRGYPPIDPAWIAVTFLWLSPILLSAAIDSRPFKKRFKGLAMYCIATAFFDAATLGLIVPRHVTLLGTIMGTVFVFGPLHLIVGILLEGTAQVIRAAARSLAPNLSLAAARATQWAMFACVMLLTVAFPFAFRANTFADLRQRGRTQAEQDWQAHRAEISFDDFHQTGTVTYNYDPETGLKIRHRFNQSQYAEAYKKRVGELLNQHGIPDWSMKDHVVADDDLIGMLDSDEMDKIEEFPHDVNDNITLMRRGSVTRWGGTTSSTGDGLTVLAKHGGSIGVGSEVEPAFVGRLAKFPEVIFVRSGRSWLGAFHDSGRFLCSAYRYEPPSEN